MTVVVSEGAVGNADVHELIVAGDDFGLWRALAGIDPANLHAPQWLRSHVASVRDTSASVHPRTQALFVWDALGPELELVRAENPGRQVIGIVRDLWPSLVCHGPLAIRDEIPQDQRYAILCLPRTGSTYLAELLAKAHLGSPREHVRDFFNALCARGRRFDELMERMMAHGGSGDYFATKLISHYIFSPVHGPDWHERLAGWLVAHDFKIIALHRDVVDIMISAYFAQRTSIWHLRRKARASDYESIEYDFSAMLRTYRGFRAGAANLERFLGLFDDVLTLEYAELDRDPGAVVRAVTDLMGAPPGPVRSLRSSLAKISDSVPTFGTYRERFLTDLANV